MSAKRVIESERLIERKRILLMLVLVMVLVLVAVCCVKRTARLVGQRGSKRAITSEGRVCVDRVTREAFSETAKARGSWSGECQRRE